MKIKIEYLARFFCFFLIHYSHATYLDHGEPGEDSRIEVAKRRLTSASLGPRSPKTRQELTKRAIQASGIQGGEHDAASLLKPTVVSFHLSPQDSW
jgi:hypothetical protein